MNNSSYPWYLTWIAIIVACIVFWPLAIVLFVLRMTYQNKDTRKEKTNKKGHIILGVILMIAGACSMVVSRILGFLLVAAGAAVVRYGTEMAKINSQEDNYSINANMHNSIEDKFEGSGASITGDDIS